MKLPIDTAAVTFLAAAPPEPVVDFQTKTPKADDAGQPIYAVQLVGLTGDGAEVISAKVAGEPKGITQGAQVKVTGLIAQPWARGDRSGISYRATRIEPAGTARSSS